MKRFFARLYLWLEGYCWEHTQFNCSSCRIEGQQKIQQLAERVRKSEI